MTMVSPTLRTALALLIRDLACGDFARIVADGRGGRLTASELQLVFEQYGRTLIRELPEEGWSLVEVYPADDGKGPYSLDLPLWTKEEGRSDLTLSLSCQETATEVELSIDDVRVL